MKKYFSIKLIAYICCGFFIWFANINTAIAQSQSKTKTSKSKSAAERQLNSNGKISSNNKVSSRKSRSARASRLSYRGSGFGYGRRSRYAPYAATTINYGNYEYRYSQGIYYQNNSNLFIVVHPPIGITVQTLPNDHYKFYHDGHEYFYSRGGFYCSVRNQFQVVHPPIGARFPQLPTDARRFEWDSTFYYASDRIFFKEIYEGNGNVIYEIVDNMM